MASKKPKRFLHRINQAEAKLINDAMCIDGYVGPSSEEYVTLVKGVKTWTYGTTVVPLKVPK